MSPCVERAVLDQLLDYFKERLLGYSTTLMEDNSLVHADSLYINNEMIHYEALNDVV